MHFLLCAYKVLLHFQPWHLYFVTETAMNEWRLINLKRSIRKSLSLFLLNAVGHIHCSALTIVIIQVAFMKYSWSCLLEDGIQVSVYIKQYNLVLFNLYDLHVNNNKLMKGKALRKHSLHEKTAALISADVNFYDR